MSMLPEDRGHPWWEQNALNKIIRSNSPVSQAVCVLRASVQYFPGNACMPPREGNFLAHTAGSSGDRKQLSALLSLGAAAEQVN